MANSRPSPHRQSSHRQAPHQQAPQAGVFSISTGVAELTHDRDGGWLLSINGAQSSHIDPDHPKRLDFEYMRQMAAVIVDAYPDRSSPLRMLHLGAAACALPRFLALEYPGSRHVAVEIDAELARLAREWFDLPRAPRLRIRVGDAREVIGALTSQTRDLIVRDAFAESITPEHLKTVEFTHEVKRVLTADGLYIANCGDRRDLVSARREVATIAAVFDQVELIADPAMFKGRRSGNIVVVAGDRPLPASDDLQRRLRADPEPARMVVGDAARAFGSGSPFVDGGPVAPAPPRTAL